ncbi:ADP-heptose:LPS heptosyltransferase [Mariniflexile fucanivorans]|uniref:ADP-heptose:LPS heptosyltransferase n=1 Tax=Mariniflexile fucanivorans TaxID=264023 RepID=A0A4R1RSC7_9FLAO|nr:glycosyltransferase family 9 protein [Mariniflexile fucanivorans]TCL69219.1 ADP-heptose:LPS heptosyltransferase [Mariniflexile fucanivorans]
MSKLPKHILVIRLSAMGDVAMTVPVLRAFTQQYPDVKITVLTRAFFSPFFRELENVSVFPAEVNGNHKGIVGLYKLSKELKNLGIDAIADLHNVLRTNILKTFFFGKRFVQIDKGRAEKKALISGENFQQLKTTHQRYADVFEALGFKLNLSNPTFPKKAILNEKIKILLGDTSKKLIGIAPFAAHEGKMYPLDVMKDVIKTLSKEYKVILFGGGKKETDILNEVKTTFENVINVAGKLTLTEELDLISNLHLMLSMDSGNAHLAAMLGVKVVTIWGVTHPFAGFAPFNQPEEYALLSDRNKYPKIPTSVYGNKYPETYKEASRSISQETVVDKIEYIISVKVGI